MEHIMSRAIFVLAATGIFCASSVLALVDASGAIASAAAQGDSVKIQHAAARQQEHEYRLDRHYRGYDEAPSAMVASLHRV
jgi:hypothetical protein